MTNRIDTKLAELKKSGTTALAPFVTIGFPDLATSEAMVETILEAGGDMLELGIPFSDPLADGPTVQNASFKALKHGVNVATALDVLRRLRTKGIEAPLVFMGYFNPFLRYGPERFVRDAADAGLDGIIVPDLPVEEGAVFKGLCDSHGIYVIPLLAPTSTDHRIGQACQGANGFIYCVSLTGVTGARKELASGLPALVSRIRRHTDLPVFIGFGVSQRHHVEEIGQFADGAVVASAMLDAIDKAPAAQALQIAGEFVRKLKGDESPR